MDTFLRFLKIRRSIRSFNNKQIPAKKLESLVDAARFAATARNLQPWEFVVVTDKQVLKRLAGIAENGRFIAEAAACIAVFSADTKYFLEDGSAATCNILLTATALGIGSCWVAGDKKPYCGEVSRLLNAPRELKLISMVALGYPDAKNVFKMMPKRELKEILHWEKF
ncbi:MAG: nitroreductase family protein [Candidatus Omnitrophica bacterium]|nr:nitroreductase family protein [Candidatus Omnitrophota bacterium]